MKGIIHICVMEDMDIAKMATELEKEIVQHLANGFSVAETGQKGGIGEKAMESKILRIRAKYGSNSIVQLVVLFMRWGLVK